MELDPHPPLLFQTKPLAIAAEVFEYVLGGPLMPINMFVSVTSCDNQYFDDCHLSPPRYVCNKS